MNSVYRKIAAILIIFLFITSVIPVSLGIEIKVNPITAKNQMRSTTDFNQNIMNLLRQHNIPGLSACIIENDEVVWSKGYGYYNRLRFLKKPDGDTIYGTGCLTTTVTVTALLQLYEKGLFDLDDDVNNYLDFELRNPNHPEVPINFTMLLTHNSSLSLALNARISTKLSSLLGFLKNPFSLLKEYLVPDGRFYNPDLWLNISPGKNASYSCMGIMVLAYLVECLSGQPFDTYCKEHIFKPLNMPNTGFKTRNFKRRNLAVPYYPFTISLLNQNRGILIRLPRSRGYHHMLGSTGLVTSANDLSHFLIAHMNGGVWEGSRILKESTVELMHTIHIYNLSTGPNSSYWGYGLGWAFYNESETIYQGHGGNDLWGFSSSMIFCDSDNLGVIMLISAWTQMEVRAAIKQEILKIAEEL